MNNKMYLGPTSLLDQVEDLDIGLKKFFKYEYLIFYEESKNNEKEVEEYCLNKKMIQTMKKLNPKAENYEYQDIQDRESEWMNDDMEDYSIDQGDADEINDHYYKMMMDEMEKDIQNDINNDIMNPKRLMDFERTKKSSKEEEEEEEDIDLEEEEEADDEDEDAWEDLDEEGVIVNNKRNEEIENDEEDYVSDEEYEKI